MIWSILTPPPSNLGVVDGKLAACPDKPNCVSTQATREDQRMDPWPIAEDGPQAIERLATIVRSLPRTKIVEQRHDYLRVEFRSLMMRFIDDVEFYAPAAADHVHFRSASRLGYSDLGVNRQRMEEIGRRFQDELPETP